MNINNKPLFEKATEDLNQLINSSFTRHIISISHDSNKKNVNNILDDYKTKYPEENVKTYQSGRTWILIGQNNNGLNSLNAGQSQNIIEEIGKIAGAIIISKKGPYYELSKDYDELSFYEICNDEYIKKTLKLTEAELRDLAYELSKDYLAEYLVAKNTAAKHWNYYGSGMDKRYYYHFDIENFR